MRTLNKLFSVVNIKCTIIKHIFQLLLVGLNPLQKFGIMKRKRKYKCSEGTTRIRNLTKKEIQKIIDDGGISYVGETFGLSNSGARHSLCLRMRELKMTPAKTISEGAKRILKLNKEDIIKLLNTNKMSCSGKRFSLSDNRASKLLRKRMEDLMIFKPTNIPRVEYPKTPFSNNEDDYGGIRANRKFINSPILPVHNEFSEVVEYYKLATMPTF